jgi:hypothetical protein
MNMRVSASLVMILSLVTAAASAGPPRRPFEAPDRAAPWTALDGPVSVQLRRLGIEPANACSDEVFVRRVFLDVIGTLPTAKQARLFLEDKSSNKRAALIDALLEQDEFADYWALKWCDLLRVKSEFPINLWPNAVQAYHKWIRTAIVENMPYDQFARAMLTSSGSNFRVPTVNFYRAVQGRRPRDLAQAAALAFMGTRIDAWPDEKRDQFAAFFSRVGYKRTAEWKEEIVYFETPAPDAPTDFVLPDGRTVRIAPDKDPRQVFADWLITPDNPSFARVVVNRIWYWLLGRGIIHEPDDLRPDNPPANAQLLVYLEQQLVRSKYDLKHIYRLILNSGTYQRSCIPASDHPQAEAQFAYYPLRRVEAETLADALCQISGTHEEYWSPIPEPFTIIPPELRSIELADGSITSSFLELFGRPPRDTGFIAERNDVMNDAQRLHMLNSSHVRRKLENGQNLRVLVRAGGGDPGRIVEEIYLTVLSRYPTEQEIDVLRRYAKIETVNRNEVAIDLIWALVNSSEFLYRH